MDGAVGWRQEASLSRKNSQPVLAARSDRCSLPAVTSCCTEAAILHCQLLEKERGECLPPLPCCRRHVAPPLPPPRCSPTLEPPAATDPVPLPPECGAFLQPSLRILPAIIYFRLDRFPILCRGSELNAFLNREVGTLSDVTMCAYLQFSAPSSNNSSGSFKSHYHQISTPSNRNFYSSVKGGGEGCNSSSKNLFISSSELIISLFSSTSACMMSSGGEVMKLTSKYAAMFSCRFGWNVVSFVINILFPFNSTYFNSVPGPPDFIFFFRFLPVFNSSSVTYSFLNHTNNVTRGERNSIKKSLSPSSGTQF